MAQRGDDGEIDYEAYTARAKRRFVLTVGSIVAALIASLYAPWAFVEAGVLRSGVAEIISCVSGLLLIGAWRGLMMKLADPADAPPGQDRRKHLARSCGPERWPCRKAASQASRPRPCCP